MRAARIVGRSAILGRMKALQLFFIFAIVAWLAAACTLANPARRPSNSPVVEPLITNSPQPTSTARTETAVITTTVTPTPSSTAGPRITAEIQPTPTVDVLACLPDDPGITGLVSWVIDGETFVIDIAGRQQTVRLLGIDAAPLTGDITRSLLDQRVVRLVSDERSRDPQGRILRYVLYLDGRFINDELIRSGAARLDPGAIGLACAAQFVTAQKQAAQAGLGIWGISALAALPTDLQPTQPANPPPGTPGAVVTPTFIPSVTPGAVITLTPGAPPAPTNIFGSPTNTEPPTVTARPPSGVTPSPTRTATQPVTTGTVVAAGVQIVHIFFDGVVEPYESDEYIEIKNFENTSIELTNWLLFEENEPGFFFFPEFTLQAGQSCRIYTYEVHDDSCVQDSFRSYSGLWDNTNDCGILYEDVGENFEERSSFCYGEAP